MLKVVCYIDRVSTEPATSRLLVTPSIKVKSKCFYSSLRHNDKAQTPHTDTGYGHVVGYNTITDGHHQRTNSQQFYNKFATSQCQSPTSRHVKMLGCGKFLSVGGEFVVQQVVELCCPLEVSVAGIRVVEFDSNTASQFHNSYNSRCVDGDRNVALKGDPFVFAHE